MLKIKGITDDFKQSKQITLPDETTFTLRIEYIPLQIGWFVNEITYDPPVRAPLPNRIFTVRSIRITKNLNLLQSYRNLIPFGIACLSQEAQEPTHIEDFISGNYGLYLLTKEDLDDYQTFVSATPVSTAPVSSSLV